MAIDWELLADLSHKIRTPLNGMTGFLKLVLHGGVDDRAEEQEFLQEAHQSALLLLNICNNLPNLEAIGNDELQINTEVKELFTYLIDELRSGFSVVVDSLTLTLNSSADDRVEQLQALQKAYDTSLYLSYVNCDLLDLVKHRGAVSLNRPLSGHFSTIRTKITDAQILKLSLEQLGYTVKLEAAVRGYRGQKVRADVVAILEGDYDIGWSRNTDGGFDLIADLWGVSKRHNTIELFNSITQQYDANTSLEEMLRK